MDISCDTMHVEISPVNSFLQRAGRCARWKDEFGEIYVYDILELEEREKIEIETDDKEILTQIRAINNKYLPYDKVLCEETFKQLSNISFLDKDIAQKLVDAILTKKEILSLNLNDENNLASVKKDDLTLILSYTQKRAKKDKYNREKGLKRLEKTIKSGKLTKDKINSRGYNKYLHLKNEIEVVINYEKFEQDGLWDGIKGYVTNTTLCPNCNFFIRKSFFRSNFVPPSARPLQCSLNAG
jgi:CRISPR/Cas system-associated endonuclease/helicase Cas3